MTIKNLNELTLKDINITGGKSSSLGEMTQASIPVPPGFVVLTGSFAQFLEETDLNVELDSILK
jgi:pyruvate, water dikinase